MHESNSNIYNPDDHFRSEQIPEDTITIIVKCGGRTYTRGVNLEDTQEKTARLATVLMQQVVDTIDAKGLKAGGSRFDPELNNDHYAEVHKIKGIDIPEGHYLNKEDEA